MLLANPHFRVLRTQPHPARHPARPLSAVRLHPGTGLPGGDGCFNVADTASPQLGSNGSYSGVIDGSSFIMAVELTPDGPRARTILAYSESANPASPHYTDQTSLYEHKHWVTERFTNAQINADPDRQVMTLHG